MRNRRNPTAISEKNTRLNFKLGFLPSMFKTIGQDRVSQISGERPFIWRRRGGGGFMQHEDNGRSLQVTNIILNLKNNNNKKIIYCPGQKQLFHNSEHHVGVSLILKSVIFCDIFLWYCQSF
jgi:hypothetical protein